MKHQTWVLHHVVYQCPYVVKSNALMGETRGRRRGMTRMKIFRCNTLGKRKFSMRYPKTYACHGFPVHANIGNKSYPTVNSLLPVGRFTANSREGKSSRGAPESQQTFYPRGTDKCTPDILEKPSGVTLCRLPVHSDTEVYTQYVSTKMCTYSNVESPTRGLEKLLKVSRERILWRRGSVCFLFGALRTSTFYVCSTGGFCTIGNEG